MVEEDGKERELYLLQGQWKKTIRKKQKIVGVFVSVCVHLSVWVCM